MKVVLILVLFNLQSGSEVITAEFDDMAACSNAAKRTFQGVDSGVETRPLVPLEGTSVIEGTMIAYGAEGQEMGMYSCSPSSTGAENG
ncbi:hypothetical protein [Ruegeria sp. YS9]|uniref:hypothetical protein n=1 Tax=Ruegeria sp. YS9 TaxID=2966453 RepID=UPI00214B19CE|nr:hypothetical protein [Ruegeria sp. YS9]UUV08679.1 hypothetical protein NOR97_20865 [Ruegeria sp. YS9]